MNHLPINKNLEVLNERIRFMTVLRKTGMKCDHEEARLIDKRKELLKKLVKENGA